MCLTAQMLRHIKSCESYRHVGLDGKLQSLVITVGNKSFLLHDFPINVQYILLVIVALSFRCDLFDDIENELWL